MRSLYHPNTVSLLIIYNKYNKVRFPENLEQVQRIDGIIRDRTTPRMALATLCEVKGHMCTDLVGQYSVRNWFQPGE